MAFFNKVTKAAISPPVGKAAAAGTGFMGQSTNNSGAGMVGVYYNYTEGEARNAAMSVATVSRSRDLICLLYTSPSPRDKRQSRMPSSA